MHLRPLHWLPLPLCLALAGCPSGSALENPDRFNEACDALPIFEQNCAGSLCHSSEDGEPPSGGVDLIAPDLPARLVGVAPTYPGVTDAETCATTPELLVDPTNPERSVLLTKVLGTQSCGDAMPIPNPPSGLDDASLKCIRSYVFALAEGAAGMGGAPGSGGASGSGGSASGGAANTGGGASTGGAANTGGSTTGGAANTGGSATGGAEGAQ